MTALISETEFDIDAVLGGLISASAAYTMVLSTPDLVVTDVNPAFLQAVECELESLQGKSLAEQGGLVPESVVEFARRAMGEPVHEPLRVSIGPECCAIPVAVSATSLPSANRLILYCVDLRQTEDLDKQPISSERQFQEIFENTPIGILLLDTVFNIFQANPHAGKLLQYSREELAGIPFTNLLAPNDHDWLNKINKEIQDDQARAATREIRLRCRSGDYIWAEANILMHHSRAGAPTYLLVQIEDVSERKRYEAQMEQLAYYDTLTGLANRRQLTDRIELALGRAKRHGSMSALLYLDLDSFKAVNDTLGHAAGDLLLKAVSERLDECTRNTDLVARPGGDEFAILLEDIHQAEDAERLAAKLISALQVPLLVLRKKLVVTCSVGITLIPQDGNSVEVLMKNADKAMYRAKQAGRNGYRFFGKQMNAKAARAHSIEQELQWALENEALEVHLQPQVDIARGFVVGAEALCRWRHPTLGLLGPEEFIPFAEESGLIVELGIWAIEQACSSSAQLSRRAGRPIRVSVNVSAAQLRAADFAASVERIIGRYDIRPEQLELELTENILIENIDKTAALLNDLMSLGVRLSIDDFGTGYCSFGYLKRLPLSTMKIDRSFIEGIPHSTEDKAIASGLIVMAHRMRMTVIAEGVETAEQLDFLRAHACDVAQGHYLGAPVPVDAVLLR